MTGGKDGMNKGGKPPVDLMRYDLLAQAALRQVVRLALMRVEKDGLPGDHHFFISFDVRHPGVELSDRLRKKYSEEMTIVIQHQFWDLHVYPEHFEVGLSFDGIPEKLVIPFDAVKGFFDPAVQFGLQFEVAWEEPAESGPAEQRSTPQSAAADGNAPATAETAEDGSGSVETAAEGDGTSGTGTPKVVSLDAFRKK